MNFIAQKRHNECGIACVGMILRHLGIKFSYRQLQKMCKGASFYEISIILDHFNIHYSMIQAEMNRIIAYPTITLFNYGSRAHFVVIWKNEGNDVFYSDPSNFRISSHSISQVAVWRSNYNIIITTPPTLSIKKHFRFYIPYKIRLLSIMLFFSFLIYKILVFFDIM